MSLSKFLQADTAYLRGLKPPQVVMYTLVAEEKAQPEGARSLANLMRRIFCCCCAGAEAVQTEQDFTFSTAPSHSGPALPKSSMAAFEQATSRSSVRTALRTGTTSAEDWTDIPPTVSRTWTRSLAVATKAKAPRLSSSTATGSADFIVTAALGGLSTGKAFDDSKPVPINVSARPITAIKIRSVACVDSIQVVYSGDSKFSPLAHGGSGGNEHTFTLASGDYITEIDVWHGSKIDALQFKTKNGVTSDKYGGTGGSKTTVHGGGRQLAYIFGTADDYLESIGFGFPTKISHYQSPLYGSSTGGSEFTDFPYVPETYMSTGISKIWVKYGGSIDKIQVTYEGLTTQPSAHGGTGGTTEKEFRLDTTQESITKVNYRVDNGRVQGLQFVSSSGRTSDWFGSTTGELQSAEGTSSCPALLAIGGRSGSLLDAIRFFWGPGMSVLYSDFTFSSAPTPADTPQDAGTVNLSNSTSVEQAVSQGFTYTETEKSTFTVEDSFSVGATVKMSAEVPFLAKMETETSFKYESKYGKTFSSETTKSVTTKFSAKVPAYSSLKGTVVVYSKACSDVAFTAKKSLVYTNLDGTTTTVDAGTVSGTFTGVNSYRAAASWNQA